MHPSFDLRVTAKGRQSKGYAVNRPPALCVPQQSLGTSAQGIENASEFAWRSRYQNGNLPSLKTCGISVITMPKTICFPLSFRMRLTRHFLDDKKRHGIHLLMIRQLCIRFFLDLLKLLRSIDSLPIRRIRFSMLKD